ncbi:MAG: LemA family protein [Desulfobacteraceae bacterium]|jgi:LemA protein|nr:LemA family protein [Desulfobacteraceae bacterium]
MTIGLLFAGTVILFVAWSILIYNRFIKLRTMVEEGWSGIDVQLKRRANLIPNLIESVKGYMSHEKSLLSDVTELRTRSIEAKTVEDQSRVESQLSQALANVFAVAENYPDLKASSNFLSLQDQLAEIEDQIQMARRYYNGTVRNLNIKVEQFPSNIVARVFHFVKAEFFEIEEPGDRAVPRVQF